MKQKYIRHAKHFMFFFFILFCLLLSILLLRIGIIFLFESAQLENANTNGISSKESSILRNTEVNTEGIRDRLYQKEKTAEVLRIAMVGDSFMYGMNVEMEETVPKRIEVLLNNLLDCPVEVINFGIPGMKLSAYPKWINNKIKDYHPDLIVFELAPQSFESDQISSLPGSLLGLIFMPLLMIKDNVRTDPGTYEHYRSSLNSYMKAHGIEQQFKLRKLENACKGAEAQCIAIAWPIKLKRHLNRFHAVHDWTVALLQKQGFGVIPVWDLYAPHSPKALNLSIFDPHPSAFADSLVAEAITQYILDNIMELALPCHHDNTIQ